MGTGGEDGDIGMRMKHWIWEKRGKNGDIGWGHWDEDEMLGWGQWSVDGDIGVRMGTLYGTL